MTNLRHVLAFFPVVSIVLVILFQALPVLAQEQQTSNEHPAWSPQSSSPQSPSAQPQSTADQPAEEDKKKSQTENSGTSKDRLGFVLPNFLTVENVGEIPPLTAKQKIRCRSSFIF
jgi:hypothetical protein